MGMVQLELYTSNYLLGGQINYPALREECTEYAGHEMSGSYGLHALSRPWIPLQLEFVRGIVLSFPLDTAWPDGRNCMADWYYRLWRKTQHAQATRYEAGTYV